MTWSVKVVTTCIGDTGQVESDATYMRFECPCGAVIEAPDHEIVPVVQRHLSDVHDRQLDSERVVAMVRPV